MIAYHFHNGTTLRDGRPLPAVGEWLVHEGEAMMCESGLHASKHPFDALQYAPGAWLDLVECEDIADEREDKLVCRRRKTLKRIDLTQVLRKFAREQALSVLHLWPDPPEVVVRWLRTGDESLRAAARDAAWDAARDAAGAAAWAAARDAAWAAAGAAAREAAWAAARISFKHAVDAALGDA